MPGQDPSRPEIDLRVQHAIATITIDRPHRRNALAPAHLAALRTMLQQADADPGVRAIVLTGAGNAAFCAGADLSGEAGFFARPQPDQPTGLGDLIRAMRSLRTPLVGRINGACRAGGMGLLAMCDLAIACDEATFALSEIDVGLFPFVVLAAFGPRADRLRGLALTGAVIGAAEAARIGLIGSSVPRAALDAAIDRLARCLAAKPAGAMRAGRAALRPQSDAGFLAALAAAEARSLALAGSPDAIEGIAAFRAKRPPRWAGESG